MLCLKYAFVCLSLHANCAFSHSYFVRHDRLFLLRSVLSPGGPIIQDTAAGPIQVGVSSFVAKRSASECAAKNFPPVFARITSGLPWIRDVACPHAEDEPSFCGSKSSDGDYYYGSKSSKGDYYYGSKSYKGEGSKSAKSTEDFYKQCADLFAKSSQGYQAKVAKDDKTAAVRAKSLKSAAAGIVGSKVSEKGYDKGGFNKGASQKRAKSLKSAAAGVVGSNVSEKGYDKGGSNKGASQKREAQKGAFQKSLSEEKGSEKSASKKLESFKYKSTSVTIKGVQKLSEKRSKSQARA